MTKDDAPYLWMEACSLCGAPAGQGCYWTCVASTRPYRVVDKDEWERLKNGKSSTDTPP